MREAIMEAALELAGAGSWESLRLHQVADHLDAGLIDIHRHFREKEDIVEAWFDRADAAMLAASRATRFEALTRRQCFRQLMLAWLGALAPYHRVTREMILGKLEPGHLHVQLPALLRISRTVQWLREACGCRDVLPRRAVAEAMWSAVFVASFVRWLNDYSVGQADTVPFLDRRLKELERLGLLDRGDAGGD